MPKFEIGTKVFCTEEGFKAYRIGAGSEMQLEKNLYYAVIDTHQRAIFYSHNLSVLGSYGYSNTYFVHYREPYEDFSMYFDQFVKKLKK